MNHDMDDEMRFHIEQYQRDLVRSGVPPAEAALRARRAFGNMSLAKEEGREAKGIPMFDEFIRNLSYAFRQVKRSPGFAAAVVLTLGLCIGVNTAVFSVIDAALLRPLPYPEPERLGEVVRNLSRGKESYSGTGQDGYAWEALKDARSCEVAAAGGISGVNLGGENRAVYIHQQRVSARYFRVVGIPLAQGREFTDAEDRDGGMPAVVLTHKIWKSFFNGDTAIVGSTIQLRGEPHLVVGITGEAFRPRELVDVWTPLKPSTKNEGAGINYRLIVRVNSGTSWAQAQAEVQTRGVAAFESRKIPATVTARMGLAPFDRANQAGLRDRLLILGAAVAVVLLIGCVNIASLMLARGSGRSREMGTRIALGGGPGSLMRQLTTESLVLGFIGGAAGLALGYATIQALQSVVARYGVWQELRLDIRVLLATMILSLSVSLLFGLAPALQAARVDVRATLLEGGSRSVVGSRSHWSRRALVLSEIALSLVLLVGAGLLVRTLLYLQNLDPGFNGTNVVTASASLQDARYKESSAINRLFRDSLEEIRRLPGVEAAAVGLHVPYQRWLNNRTRIRVGSGPGETEIDTGTALNYVTSGYFEVLRIPVRTGRVIDERDTLTSLPVAVVNETFARMFLKGRDVFTSYLVGGGVSRQIVGVVGDLQQQPGLSGSGPITQEPAAYIPATQFSTESFRMAHTWFPPNWVVRATARREEIGRGIERAIAAVDPLLPVASIRSMTDERDRALGSQRVNAWLLGALAALAVALAVVGVYGIVANSVAERTREFGIRMALGSSVGRVIWSAVAPGLYLSVAGVAIGGLIAAGAVRVIKGLLYGVQPIDVPTFVIVAAALIAVSGLASLIPALSLTRLGPSNVLRQD